MGNTFICEVTVTFNISKLHKDLSIVSQQNASTHEAMLEMKEKIDTVFPDEYICFISQMSEVEISIKDLSFVRIWGAKGVVEMNNAYYVQKYIPGGVAIGDDEEGSVIFYAKGKSGYGLYKVGFGNLDIDDAEYVADSLRSFLLYGIGVSLFLA